MSLTLVATLRCDLCPTTLVVDESPLHARNIAITARHLGWRTIVGNRDICPACWQLTANPQGVLSLEAG